MKLLDQLAGRFRALPIRQKLRVAFLMTTAVASLLAGVAIVAADSLLYYGNLQGDLASFVRIVGDNSTGALAFDDAAAAKETLAALRARSHVETACLYKYNGARLAAYHRPGHTGDCPLPAGERIVSYQGALIASHRIEREGQMLGHLVVRYDLTEIRDRVKIYGATVLAALMVSSAAALLLSSRLRAAITRPVLELAAATRAAARSQDYSIRVEKRFDDEVGALADALNHMMAVIQSRENDLQRVLSAQQDAVARLAQLNADLKRSNLELARSNQDLECFAFVASHDLQEPCG